MKTNDVKLGGFYVSKTGWIVREIVSQADGGVVRWCDYNLEDGRLIGDGVCSKQSLAQWAERIATQEEISRLRTTEAFQAQLARGRSLMDTFWESIPDEVLLAEVRRRGLL